MARKYLIGFKGAHTDFGPYRVVRVLDGGRREIEFIRTGVRQSVAVSGLGRGEVRDIGAPTVCGVGVSFEGATQFGPEYALWRNLVRRCYDREYLKRHPSYRGCSMSVAWQYFAGFLAELPTVPGYSFWTEDRSCELDKDFQLPGNRVYCVTRCQFVPKRVNRWEALNRRKRVTDGSEWWPSLRACCLDQGINPVELFWMVESGALRLG